MKAEKKATLAAAKSAAEGGVLAKGSARALVFDVLEHLEKKAAAALAAGDMPTYRDVKRELLTMKWEQRELATERTPAAFTKRAMFGTPLFGPKVRTHTLPDVDRDVDYR